MKAKLMKQPLLTRSCSTLTAITKSEQTATEALHASCRECTCVSTAADEQAA